jgi:hypothetical protein
VTRRDTRSVPIRDRRRGLLGRRESVELIGVSLERPDHLTRMFPPGDPAFGLLMAPLRLLALAVLWATSTPWRLTVAALVLLALLVLGH